MSTEIVAVDFSPTKWAVFCELCDSYVGEPTTDGDEAETLESAHLLSHQNQARPKLAPLSDCGAAVGVESSQLNVEPAVFFDSASGFPPPRFLLRQAVACAADPVVPELNDNGVSTSGPL